MQDKDLKLLPEKFGMVSRRDFLKFCAVVSAGMGLPLGAAVKMAEAVASPQRTPVIWLHGQDCTACSETLLRSTHPTVDHLILDLISLDYHETLSTAAGHQVEQAKKKSMEAHRKKFILVVEGSIPTKDGGIYCKIGGKPMVEILKETAPLAMGIVAIGSCASWGGIPSADPNPTGAVGVQEALGGQFPVINVPGCPPNPYNFLSTVLYILTFKKLPDLDKQGRPVFAYRRLIHEHCERRPHFDTGRFALEFDDDGHRQGWCLYKLGCKGPETHNNCPAMLFGDVGPRSWPVGTGSPCFGCSEKEVAFAAPVVAQASLTKVTPPDVCAPVVTEKAGGASAGTVGVAAGLAGLAIGAGAMTAWKLGHVKPDSGKEAEKVKPDSSEEAEKD
jgi:hydrogenase small subunit